MSKYIKLFQDTIQRIQHETNNYIEPYLSLTLNDTTYSATFRGTSNNIKNVTCNADGTYTVSFNYGPTITTSSTNCLICHLNTMTDDEYIELPSDGVADGQDTTFTINGTTYNGIWHSDDYMSGWELKSVTDTGSGTSSNSASLMGSGQASISIGYVFRLIITERSNGMLMHYNKTKLATLTLTDGSIVKIEGYFNDTIILSPDMIDPYRETLAEVVIHKAVNSIEYGAFSSCTSLTNVTIQDGLKSISSYAFGDCTNLNTINIPDSVTDIDYGAFIGCTSLPVEGNVRYADTYVVEAADKTLTTCTLKEGTRWINDSAFRNCTSLTSVTIPDGVTSIGNSTFSGCTNLNTINIPASVKTVDNSAFDNCTSLPVEGNVRYADTYVVGAVNKNLTSCILKEGSRWINFAAFSRCTRLTSITLPDSLESIGHQAFSWCTSLKSITIPRNVTHIDSYVFEKCSSITSMSVDSNNTVYDSRNNCNAIIKTDTDALMYGCSSTFIPSTVKIIDYLAFDGCTGLTSITIPGSVKSIANSSFRGCGGLTSITVDSSNTVYDSRNNCNAIIETATDKLVRGSNVTVIPGDIKAISNYAFSGCSGLTNVTIPAGVTSIGNDSFTGCSGLTVITIPSGVTSIADSVFFGCKGLTSITIPDSVTSIGVSAFANCTKLASITIPSYVTYIGGNAFYGCTSLNSITSLATTAPKMYSNYTFYKVKSNGTLYVPTDSTGYDVWMGTSDFYLGKYNWTKVEQ